MPIFIIETTAESPIREFWQVEAETAEQARDNFEAGFVSAFLWDEVQGDETEREVAQVHPRADLAGALARHNAQQEAPAMLAALGHALQALEGDWERTREVDEIRAILSRIDGAPTAEPAAPSGEAARPTYAELANAARDAAEWFASGGEVGGCLLDDREMAARFAGLVAAMGGEC